MGGAMARNIAAAGYEVRVWNRSREKAERLAGDGVTVAGSPSEAVAGSAFLVTMLADGPVVDDVITQAAPGLAADQIWLQTSTVGPEWFGTLSDHAARADLVLCDTPVLGTKKPAEAGELVVLAAVPSQVRERVQPVLDAIGRRTIWLEKVGEATRLKIVINAWILTLTAALGETIALARAIDVDPQRFLEAIDGEPMGMPYAQIKGSMMVAGDYPTSFAAGLALKDARLAMEAAAAAGLALPLSEAVTDAFARTVEAGYGHEDMSAVHRVLAP